jgi:hypothetical protein
MPPSNPRRRLLLQALALAGSPPVPLHAQPAPKSIAVLPPDFIDHHHNPDPAVMAAQQRRLPRAHEQLQRELAQRQLYRVLDFAPARPLLDELLRQQEFMHTCIDCAVQLGRKLGADLVMTSWVQKISELILNFNVEVIAVDRERVLLTKSVDMRSNNDESWERSVRYLVRDMAEKRQANPRYGT